MTVRELLTQLQHLPRDLEVLASEAGCEEYWEREVDEVVGRSGVLASRGPMRRTAA